MKVWFEGILEQEDGDKQCYRCYVWQEAGKTVYQEFQMVTGSMPNPTELHPDPTGRFMCSNCGKMTLV